MLAFLLLVEDLDKLYPLLNISWRANHTLQLGSILGPAAAGGLIARFGLAAAYGVNAASFLIVVVALLFMQNQAQGTVEKSTISLSAVREGLNFVFVHPVILPIMFLDFLATFFSTAIVLLPVFAQDILRVGPQGYGWLYASRSCCLSSPWPWSALPIQPARSSGKPSATFKRQIRCEGE